MKNNTFDIKRFALLTKRDVMQDWKKYALQVAALLGIMLSFPMYYTYTKYDSMTRLVKRDTSDFLDQLNFDLLSMATILFVCAFLIYTSNMMSVISDKRKRIDYLLLPCSSLEKYLSRLLIHTIGFVAVFFICLFIADIVRMGIFSVAYPALGVKALDLGALTNNRMFGDTKIFTILSTVLLSVVAFFTLGSTFWQKYAVVKNVVALTVIIFLYIGFNRVLIGMVKGRTLNILKLTNNETTILIIAIFGCLALFFWILGYFRFKETELTNRW